MSEPKISKKLQKIINLLIESLESTRILEENEKFSMASNMKKQSHSYIKEIETLISIHPI